MSSFQPENTQGWIVLIVDDHWDNVNVAQTALEFYGAEVHIARNGQEGLQLLEQFTPSIILLDLSMPVMDGWTMFDHIRARPETATVPVIAVTAHAMDTDREAVLQAGFNGYIPKPYDVTTLVPTLCEFLC